MKNQNVTLSTPTSVTFLVPETFELADLKDAVTKAQSELDDYNKFVQNRIAELTQKVTDAQAKVDAAIGAGAIDATAVGIDTSPSPLTP